jgi:hypothetical protein
VRALDAAERRRRIAVRHHLAPGARASSLLEATESLVALHATDPATVFLSAWARLRDPDLAAMQRALYDERTVLRMLAMRRTVFVVSRASLPVVRAASTDAVAAQQRRRFVGLLEQAGIAADGAAWVREVEDATVAALAARGEAGALAGELADDVPRLREPVPVGSGRWAGHQPASFFVILLLAASGRIVRGRPRGSWTSTQYRYATDEGWFGAPLPQAEPEAARAELARRWLAAFGPAPAADLRWWTGWTAGELKRVLAAVGPAEVALDGGTGLVLPDDLEPTPAPAPWAALLPALDPTVMGWAERGWYLGAHAPALFDRSGNAGPTVWWDGRVVGGWGQRPDGEVVVRLLEDVGAEAAAAVAAETARLQAWLGGVRVTPRFRTPLERELAAA